MYRNNSLLICLALTGVFISSTLAQQSYKLVWSDEFNGDSIDRSKWQFETNCDGGGNNELQCYTNRAQNAFVKDGSLHLQARPENFNNKGFTSARLNTAHAASWKYGKFETRAKLPKGDYLWPAIWMMPKDSVYGGWAASGEIDIMESRGQTPRTVEGTVHHGGSWPNNVYTGSGPKQFNFDFTDDFHVFTLIWERDQIQWLVDGNVYHTQNLVRSFYSGRGANPYKDIRQPFDQQFFFILNVAIGGGFFGAQANALTQAMARNWAKPEMLVDYVRVYQLSDGPVIPNPVPVPSNPTSAQPPKTSANNVPSQSVGVSTARSTVASTVISTAATSAVVTAASSAQTTFVYSQNNPATSAQQPATSAQPPATSSNNGGSSRCPGGCGGNPCCDDQRIGPVCYSTNTHVCAQDGGKFQLCGKGSGSCNGACFDANLYRCANGKIAPK